MQNCKQINAEFQNLKLTEGNKCYMLISSWDKLQIMVDILYFSYLNSGNRIHQTVEAEITAVMPLQRVCDAENQARNKLSNGPLRAQSNEVSERTRATSEYSAT